MNVVSQDVYIRLVYSKNDVVVWKELRETYDKVDGSVVYNLLQKINSVKQGGSLVVDYYHRLNSLWREFDALTKLPKCICDVKCSFDASKEMGLHQQLMKLIQFLMGLDDCYQPVKSSLLTRDPLPEVKDAYNMISRKESHRGVPESSSGTESKKNATSFVVKTFNNNKKQFNNNGNNFTRGRNQSDRLSATQIGDQNWSEGNVQNVVNGYGKLSIKPHVILKDINLGLLLKVLVKRKDLIMMKLFSPVVKMVTVRCLVSIVVVNKWPLYQLDVNYAFLYGDLVEDAYMTLPDGYTNVDKSKVCKLNKSLYGLKQAPRQWNAKLTTALAEHGFEQSKFDYSLYTKHRSGMFIALRVYVNDIVITGSDVDGINEFTLFLSNKFLIKDLGSLKYLLGIEVIENELGLCMTQRKYCMELLHEYGLLAARPIDIPLPKNTIFKL
nr:ribonuclease H-like domain-containing protein [Tanacetum cinerariifolium]